MCGFVGAFDLNSGGKPLAEGLRDELRVHVLEMSKRIRHRGPDWSGVYTGENAILSHERLSIVDPLSGKQPLVSDDGKIILAANGEIYNHKKIREAIGDKYHFRTGSDCEVIIPLYKECIQNGFDFSSMIEKLSGIFAFALYDSERDVYLVARDEIGVIPLYQGWDKNGHYYVASELKALEGECVTIEEFPNGCYLWSGEKNSSPVKWYYRDWESYEAVKNNQCAADKKGRVINPEVIEKVRNGLESAVKAQLMSDVPYGVLLSGGLDSSIIAAITQKYSKKRIESDSKESAWWPQLHSFAVGLEGSPDLVAAKKAADYIGTVHHEVHFTIQEALDALPDVIYHIETYDITTVRASTPMYLLARVIKSMGIKMVLSGEGSDELFGGYLYFHKAPNAEEFHEELVRKMSKLHLYDCLRANKSLMAWGVEGRVPFLDKDFIDIAMRLNPEDKMNIILLSDGSEKNGGTHQRMEKWILRKAFEDMLPEDICWRQKEQFSDGVGYNWIDTLKRITEEKVSDAEFARRENRFPVNPPKTKEEYYYREIYSRLFPSDSAAKCVPHEAGVACSTAKALEWDAAWKNMDEPSGRAINGVHNDSYK
ncbi:asparagine synthase B [Treponema rectale]|uniref:asparagine synthase (glutamine-hydrolyzing) n=1 Tax=Treponema rectale TaxID=744512 RepID=A0A840SIK0_9SPIR|nr:asparagine synthase B [Treponema rectale]MBB5219988.1 asparagine synthase (glutamine-hydrolyzing) [Treponema rectale]QOS40691.1 asparagine synthase B [Treponema rectale]